MITGFVSIIVFKFFITELESVGKYFIELDVLAPSFATAMIAGYVVSRIFPRKAEDVEEDKPEVLDDKPNS